MILSRTKFSIKLSTLFLPFIGAFVLLVAAVPAHAAVLVQDSYSDYSYRIPDDTADSPKSSSNGYALLNDNQALSAGQAGTADGYAIQVDDAAAVIAAIAANNGANIATGITECSVPHTLGSGGIGCSGTWNFYSFGSPANVPTASADNHFIIITLGTPVNLVAGKYYAISIGQPGPTAGGRNLHFIGSSAGTCSTNFAMNTGQVDCPYGLTHLWVQVYGSSFVPPPPADPCNGIGTCIATVIPPHDSDGSQARATSTTFAFETTGYVASDDWLSGTKVEQKYIPDDYDQLAAAICAVGGCYITALDETVSDGAFDLATTTNVQRVGWYTMKTKIYAPHQVFGIAVPFWNDTLTATTTRFLVATSSPLDNIKSTIGGAYENVITGAGDPTMYCNFSSILTAFDFTAESNILTCLLGVVSSLTVPNEAQRTAIATNFQNSFATRVPFGYITRFVALASPTSSSTPVSTLPMLTIGFPGDWPYAAGAAININPWNLTGTSSILYSATSSVSYGSKTLRQIIEPGWNILWLCLLAVAIIIDALRMRAKHS